MNRVTSLLLLTFLSSSLFAQQMHVRNPERPPGHRMTLPDEAQMTAEFPHKYQGEGEELMDGKRLGHEGVFPHRDKPNVKRSMLGKTGGQLFLPDTVIVYTNNTADTSRYSYIYDGSGNRLTELHETWNGTQWVNDFRYTWTYDGSGNWLTELCEGWDGTQWVNVERSTWTYDGSGNMLTRSQERWDGTQWVPFGFLITCTYDANGNMLTELSESWNGTQWVSSYRTIFTYDGGGNRLTELREDWDGTQWVDSWRNTCTYDGSGNRLTSLLEHWDGTQWGISERRTYTYDANGNMLTELYETWAPGTRGGRWTYTYDGGGNILTLTMQVWDSTQWVNSWRWTYTYDANGNMLTWTEDLWDGTQWLNLWRRTYTYDANGMAKAVGVVGAAEFYRQNMLTGLYETWDGTQWAILTRWTYTYDGNGNLTSFKTEQWLDSLWAPTSCWRGPNFSFRLDNNVYRFCGHEITISYSAITTSIMHQLNGVPGSYQLGQNYPNPFNPKTVISYKLSVISSVTLRIFDVLGREVATLVNEEQPAGVYQAEWDARVFSGVYFYRLEAVGVDGKRFVETKKMTLVR